MLDVKLPAHSSQVTSLEEQQEINLHKNWEVRKDLAKTIGRIGDHRVVSCAERCGRRTFYILYKNYPVGYISGHLDLDGQSVQIGSTYLSPIARRQGMATAAYGFIIRQVGTLVSDYTRSEGGEALWQKLKRDPSLCVTQDGANVYKARLK